MLSTFHARWPALFGAHPIKPLKIGIGIDILIALEAEVPKKLLRDALRRWTGNDDYLAAIAPTAPCVTASMANRSAL